MITGRQIRAARALLGWDAAKLAEEADLRRETISNIENGTSGGRETSLHDIIQVFSQHGIEFTDNQGVRFKPSDIEVFEGPERFSDFYEIVYEHLSKNGGNVCIGGSDASLYSKYRTKPEEHRKRMAELAKKRKDLNVRILCKEGDFNFVATSYAKYRWQKAEYFSPTTFYTFGDYLALISFYHEPAPNVILIKSAPYAEAYRHSFNLAWETAKEPPVKSASDT